MKYDRLILATNNQNKIAEITAILSGLDILLLSKADFVDFPDVPETGATLEENALLKARAAYAKYQVPCIADDTGLLVDHLNGAPGVMSARYAGENCSYADNNKKLLAELAEIPESLRTAAFVTVIALVDAEGEHCFVGEVKGRILEEARGDNGFGYDPVFFYPPHDRTFAEMNPAEKNLISHRSLALRKLWEWLSSQT